MKVSSTSPSPRLACEPDYSSLPSLQSAAVDLALPLAPLVIIGVGATGEAVVETLVSWLTTEDGRLGEGAQFLVVRVANVVEASRDAEFVSRLAQAERLELRLYRGGNRYVWYDASRSRGRTLDDVREWTRPDSRLSLFQDLQQQGTSSLWETLQEYLARGENPAVWLVGGAYEIEASGMIFDLAHIVRLVGEAQNYHPFIGWLLALPDEYESYDSGAETMATLRELQRLLLDDAPRIYEYASTSSNYKLRRTEASGSEDANAVLLCDPPTQMDRNDDESFMTNRMALTLLALLQPDVLAAFREDVRARGVRKQGEDAAMVSLVGAFAHYVPIYEMQAWVRARLTQDILLGRDWGVARSWRPSQVEPDVDGARAVLRSAGHPLLEIIGSGSGSSGYENTGMDNQGAGETLAWALRQALQRLVDGAGQQHTLLACEGLLSGLEEVLLDSSLTYEVMKPLEDVVKQARTMMKNWRTYMRKHAREQIEVVVSQADDAWARALGRSGWYSVLAEDVAEHYYQRLVEQGADIRQNLVRYVRWAWVMESGQLALKLDTLFPGWSEDTAAWRHDYHENDFSSLWYGVHQIVTALTREPRYWPDTLTAPKSTLQDPEETKKELAKTLGDYAAGRRMRFQVGSDSTWQKKNWTDGKPISLTAILPTWGLLLQVDHMILLEALRDWDKWRTIYAGQRGKANTMHITVAEQLAVQIEQEALGRDKKVTTWLSGRTVATLQWEYLVILFVKAWLAGMVTPAFGPGPYRIIHPDSQQELWRGKSGHPLEALHAFVFAHKTSQDPLATTAMVEEALGKQAGGEANVRMTDIAGWRESPAPQNVEWWILVNGMALMHSFAEAQL